MRDRIDPLIAERAPWMYGSTPGVRYIRELMHLTLGYDRTIKMAKDFRDVPASEIMKTMGELLARDVTVKGLEHVPTHGPALIVANHPTGIADGIILHNLLMQIRPDPYYMANSDILRILPQMADVICPVEWRKEKRSLAKTRETMLYVREATQQGRLGVIFPSGRLAKRRGLRLYERPWMASPALLARKFELPVVPVNIQARNSALFYLLDLLHPTLRDVTLFHETLNKDNQPFRITIGKPIAACDLPRNSEKGIEFLREQTLSIAGSH